MVQKEFAKQLVQKIQEIPEVIGLAAGGSWITNDMDAYSDIDLVLVTSSKISGDKNKMTEYANKFGNLINSFTGEHVGEPRLLICLYDNPLIHVDIKFITLDELKERVEDPVILFERNNQLTEIIKSTSSCWPPLDFQWIEDRFWTWIHYATLKIGRGENFEALDFISYLRIQVLSPLLQLKNKQQPRGLRKVETNFKNSDLKELINTVAKYDTTSIIQSLEHSIDLYIRLRTEIFPVSVILREKTQKRVVQYFKQIKSEIQK